MGLSVRLAIIHKDQGDPTGLPPLTAKISFTVGIYISLLLEARRA